MFIRTLILTIIFLMLLSSCGNDRDEKPTGSNFHLKSREQLAEILEKLGDDPDNLGMNISVWIYYTQTGNFQELINHARPVYERAAQRANERLQGYAGSYLAQSYLFIDNHDSLNYYLNEVSDIARKRDDSFLIAMNSNIIAIQALKVEMDYPKALDHFKIALDLTEETGNLTSRGILLCNIANTYLLRNDRSGVEYALEAYNLGESTNDIYVIGYGTMLMARLLTLERKYDEALVYANELLELSQRPGQERHALLAYMICGNIFSGKGDSKRARGYYEKALGHINHAEGSAVIQAYLDYGNFLLSARHSRQAMEVFREGMSISDDKHNIRNRHELLLGLSQAYQDLGMSNEALHYYKMYHAHSDSIFSILKERAFSNLLMKYERTNHQKEMQNKELHLMMANRRQHLAISVMVVIIILAGNLYVMYRRKNRMYQQLVEQHQDYLKRERSVKLSGVRAEESHADAGNTETSLFNRLESLMSEQFVYRHNDISLDKLAEMLDTNRAYISRVINRYANMSFYDYINSRRITEAASILSDPDNDIPLKALSDQLGYNSLSAFYRYFQKETGVPPSKYREKVRVLWARSKSG